jgi:hypothetical protein
VKCPGSGDIRFPLAALALAVVASAASSCASRNYHPAALYGLTLEKPHVFKQPTGTAVPCGKGIAWLFRDLLWTCTIDRRTTIRGHDLPAGATLWFRGDGTLEQAAYIEREETLFYGEDPSVKRVVRFDDWGEDIVRSPVERSRRRGPRPRVL